MALLDKVEVLSRSGVTSARPARTYSSMNKLFSTLLWLGVAALGAGAYATIALRRGEPLNSIYILVAALCTYAVGFRFYSKWIAAKVMMLDDRRATPCEVNDDGHDFVKTNKWIVFGHHFAAISGPGPLVGPVLAAQFGYLPGTLWILIGVVLGGAVQDFVILFCSMRRNGRSLGQMVKEELNSVAGVIGLVAILAIMVILLAVLALVVVNALETRMGFIVDEVIGDNQTVIKPLGRMFKSSEGLSGATILGDGGVALIIDVNRLAVSAQREEALRLTMEREGLAHRA